MKKIIKSLSFILLVCFVFISIPINAKALTTNDEMLNFAKEQIILLSDSLEESNWDDSSEIYNVITLYDLDDNVNGYIYEIRTNGSDAGFIQIDISTGEKVVSSFSLEGNHALNSMIEQSEKIENYNLKDISKIIHLGGYNYFVESKDAKQKDGNLLDLSTDEKITESLDKLRDEYNEQIELRKNYNINKLNNDTREAVKKYVPNATNSILVEMNDFNGLSVSVPPYVTWVARDGHCSPTVGTNIIKYWAKRRGVSNLYYSSDSWVFRSLVVNMKTYINNSTTTEEMYNGLWNYGASTRGVTPTGGDIKNRPSYAACKTTIDSGVPFILNLSRYQSGGGHSVATFGYYEYGSNYLIINNGWNKVWTFELYNNLAIDNYVYSRWN